MSRNVGKSLGAIILLLEAMLGGCSAGKGSGGSGVTGSGGVAPAGSGGGDAMGSGGTSVTGSGGMTGSAGTSVTGVGGDGGAGGAKVPLALVCSSAVKNKGVCITDTDMACANGCGPNKAGFKNCNCYSNVWDCPMCEYLPGDYSCYKLPAPLSACPPDNTDPSGLMLVAAGSPCTAPPCTPCGSAPLNTYRDSIGALKAGYCVCAPGTDTPKWSCASVSEWPPQQ